MPAQFWNMVFLGVACTAFVGVVMAPEPADGRAGKIAWGVTVGLVAMIAGALAYLMLWLSNGGAHG